MMMIYFSSMVVVVVVVVVTKCRARSSDRSIEPDPREWENLRQMGLTQFNESRTVIVSIPFRVLIGAQRICVCVSLLTLDDGRHSVDDDDDDDDG